MGKQIDELQVQYNMINDAKELIVQMDIWVYVSAPVQYINLIIFPEYSVRI